jgi:hypothetical protein
MSTRHELDRIIIGNQLAIMRAVQTLVRGDVEIALNIRVHDIKEWWRRTFNEEVGFSATLGDRPPLEKAT